MDERTHRYQGDGIEVTYDARRCIHAAECVRGLPAVFDTARRPWVQPGNASADAVAAVVERCPTGALHYARHDGAAAEAPAPHARVAPQADGPLYLRGDLDLRAADGTPIARDTRLALCRCGHSATKPFCDNSHRAAGFRDAGQLAEKTLKPAAEPAPAALVITATANGPLQLSGALEICDAAGQTCRLGGQAYLCRCGGSGSKPFCDGTHSKNGFQG